MELMLKLIVFLPLISGSVNGIFCKKFSNKTASIISSSAIVFAAICAVFVFNKAGIEQDAIHIILTSWININSINVSWAIYVDQLTSIMILLVTSVSAVVHIYSLGYMSDDKN